jgi:hypothetical protein
MMVFTPVPADAADAYPVEEAQQFTTGPYFSITGAYLFNDSDNNLSFDPEDDKVGDLDALPPGDNGWLAAIALGAPIDPVWDWKVSGTAVWLSESESSASPPNEENTEQHASNDLNYQTLDLEFGYHPNDMANLRLFAGARFLHAKNEIDYGYVDIDDDKLGDYNHDNSVLGIGPRLGLDASFPITDSGLQLITSASGSVLWGHFERDRRFEETGGFEPAGSGSESSSDNGAIFNLEGLAALRFNITDNTSLDVGYRAQHWWNMLDSVFNAQSGDGDFEDGGRTDVFVHGPFATFTIQLP